MSHPGELLSAFLDGELVAGERRQVMSHLAECAECRAELADLDAARSAVRSLPMLDPPLELSAFEVPVAPRPAVGLTWARAGAAAAAAVVAVAVGLAAFGSDPATPAVDLGSVIDQHAARVSVDPGLTSVRLVSVVNQP